MDLKREFDMHLTRRQLFSLGAKGIGAAALALLFKQDGFSFVENEAGRDPKTGGLVGLPHYAPKVKRVIFL
ncbi:MAG TPA: sulfatase, partial [Blastocatellia bacterium]|nr:sulfatase [Blastocatellia bacterium]